MQIRVLLVNWWTGENMGLANIKYDVVKHRKGYWANDNRNNVIRRVVEEVVPKYCLEQDPQILILVDKTEHALRLAKLLPEFTAVYGALDKESEEQFKKWGILDNAPPDKKKIDQLKKDFSAGKLRKAIATGIWNTGVDFPNLAVVIRADGGASAVKDIQIPGRVARIAEGKYEGLLIDLADNFDTWAGRRADMRLKTYKSMGWTLENVEI